jgi:hypothetical protein
MSYQFDQDAVNAGLDLFRRCGAKEVQFGYLHENVPIEQADWYAWAQFHNGEKIMVAGKAGPVEAVETLARRLINGGKCTHCLQTMTLSGSARDGVCRWTRQGDRWQRGCVESHPEKQLLIKASDFVPGEAY